MGFERTSWKAKGSEQQWEPAIPCISVHIDSDDYIYIYLHGQYKACHGGGCGGGGDDDNTAGFKAPRCAYRQDQEYLTRRHNIALQSDKGLNTSDSPAENETYKVLVEERDQNEVNSLWISLCPS